MRCEKEVSEGSFGVFPPQKQHCSNHLIAGGLVLEDESMSQLSLCPQKGV